jgi:hypothetical protein
LLQWLEALATEVREGKQLRLLREVFAQQYELDSSEPQPVKVHATGLIQTPHDPDAQWSAKAHGSQKKSWTGYKVQVAESFGDKPEANAANFITSIVTQKASESDDPGLEESLREQTRSGLEGHQNFMSTVLTSQQLDSKKQTN